MHTVIQAYCTFLHSLTRSGSIVSGSTCLPSKWGKCLAMQGSFIHPTLLFIDRLVAIKNLKDHNHKEFNKISAYFKNLCLKLNFDKCENAKCHPFLMEPKFYKSFTIKNCFVVSNNINFFITVGISIEADRQTNRQPLF